jgi:outer membrane protein OmpA-like peptidoglycan-associated protein
VANRGVVNTAKSLIYWLVLMACPYAAARAQAQPETGAMLPVSITILYFDQSSPVLRPRVKTTLDSLAGLLKEQPTLMATLTGYTDDVGKRELNLLLAEKRARAVERYLKQRGVLAGQLMTSWEGPDPKASKNAAKTTQTIGRRVVVQLLPK